MKALEDGPTTDRRGKQGPYRTRRARRGGWSPWSEPSSVHTAGGPGVVRKFLACLRGYRIRRIHRRADHIGAGSFRVVKGRSWGGRCGSGIVRGGIRRGGFGGG